MTGVVDLSWPIDEQLPIEIGEIKFHRDHDYDDIGARTAQRFLIVVAPLPLKGVEAAPARVLVIED